MRSATLAEFAPLLKAATGGWKSTQRLSGGDIASAFLIKAQRGRFVLKVYHNPPHGFFAAEAEGLHSLASRSVRVPQVVQQADDYLLMDYVDPGEPDYFAAGVMLARLHATGCENYGSPSDNYLATIGQINTETRDWSQFYLEHRIAYCLSRLAGLSASERQRWRHFAGKASTYLQKCPHPSWLHGDLWAGNLLMGVNGPVFIDPACYAGDALVDIAMTHLFGSFPAEFYEGYRSVLPVREHEAELIRIYQLYPLLVHAILFDAGDCLHSGYYRRAAALRDAFL